MLGWAGLSELPPARLLRRHRRVLDLSRPRRRAAAASAASCSRRSSTRPASAATGSWCRASSRSTPPAARSAAAAASAKSASTKSTAVSTAEWLDVVIVERLIPENLAGAIEHQPADAKPEERTCLTQSLPVVIIGAGPVGLAAAAHALSRGLTPLVLEAGARVGDGIRRWGHVRMFSPWKFNVDSAAAAHPRARRLDDAGRRRVSDRATISSSGTSSRWRRRPSWRRTSA